MNNNLNKSHDITDIEISEKRREFTNLQGSKKTYKRKNKKIWYKMLIFFISSLIFFSIISYFLHSATVEVEAKKENFVFSNDIYTASISDKNTIKKSNTGQSEISKISIGEISIKNNTSKRQSLRKETRFETQNGLIFKTYSAVTIKPKTTVTVKAFSDGVGVKYNVKKGENLTIPGFKEAKMEKEFKNITGSVAKNFVLSKDDTAKKITPKKITKTEGSIKYSILQTELEKTQEVKSIGVTETKNKSEGIIEITNTSSKTQKLRKETRFASSNGNIYKTFKSVTIPKGGKVKTEIFSVKEGKETFLPKDSKLTIPGFKEAKMEKEFKEIYAFATTDIKGGFIGKTNIPNKEELEKAKENLKSKILDELTIETKKQKKDSDIILGNNFHTSYDFSTESVKDKVILKVKATQKVPIISKKDFLTLILKSDNITKDDIKNIEIQNYSKLIFRILNPESFNIDSGDSFNFAVKGDAVVGWVLNQEQFKKEIEGKSESEIKNIMKTKYKNFNLNILISPFWRSSVPSDIDDIDILIKE